MNIQYKNHEGYADPTAYLAMKGLKMDTPKRGEIWTYINNRNKEMKVLVISDENMKYDSDSVAVLTLKEEKRKTDYYNDNIEIVCQGLMYTSPVLLGYCRSDLMMEYIKTVSGAEMKRIDDALRNVLRLPESEPTSEDACMAEVATPYNVTGDVVELPQCIDSMELVAAQAELKIYKELYERLLEKVMSK